MSGFESKEFPEFDAPKAEKRNPRSILSVLWHICKKLEFRNEHEAAIALNKHTNFSWGRSRRLSSGILKHLFKQETDIKYWELETFARMVGVPTGVLLIFSRLRSNQQQELTDDNEKILRLLRSIGDRDPAAPLEIDDLFRWRDELRKPIPVELQMF